MKQTTFTSRSAGRAFQVLVWAAALTIVGCDNDVNLSPTEPEWPLAETHLSMISGNDQAGMVGQPLDAPFVVQVVDQHGAPISGAVVGWDIVEGGGDLPAAPKGPNKLFHETKTDASGFVSIVLTLGPRPGRNAVTAQTLFGEGISTFVARGKANG